MVHVDVLIPTYRRPAALAVTLAALVGQTFRDFSVVVSDQTEEGRSLGMPEVRSVVRLLRGRGHNVATFVHRPRRGMAEHRQFLLDHSSAPYVLFLDDDVLLEPDLLGRLVTAITEQRCGFVGSALIGLTYLDDIRPQEQNVEFWDGDVAPERVVPTSREWERYTLHNACNVLHAQQRLGIASEDQRLYKVAWVGGCVLYDAAALRAVGGFSFHDELPLEHSGEDVLAQLRVMERFGGCGIMPSGAYHQELPTTIPKRPVDAARSLT